MKHDAIGLSFGYMVNREHADDGVTVLDELDVRENGDRVLLGQMSMLDALGDHRMAGGMFGAKTGLRGNDWLTLHDVDHLEAERPEHGLHQPRGLGPPANDGKVIPLVPGGG